MNARRIAVVNTGSATLKLALFEADGGELRERSRDRREWQSDDAMESAIENALRGIGEKPDMLGHRVVHGGSTFREPVRIDGDVEKTLEELASLAPLHNGPALTAIRIARRVFADTPSVAVFDTAFHARRPEASMRYALPREWYEEFGFRRYGFHGLAHASLVQSYARASSQAAGDVSAVTLQLGAGCSACAVRNGRSIETSMGYTPLEGLVMATRSGDIDPAIVLSLLRGRYTADEIERQLNRGSGLLGLAGNADMREVLAGAARGNEGAQLALELFVHRLVLTIGAYLTLLGGEGAIVFGGGIGEHAPQIRTLVAQRLTAWDVALDPERNRAGRPGLISTRQSRPVYVFETREEPLIASELACRFEELAGGAA